MWYDLVLITHNQKHFGKIERLGGGLSVVMETNRMLSPNL